MMTTRFGSAFLALVTLAGGCLLACGTRKDPSTGMVTRSKGLSLGRVTATVDGAPLETNDVQMGKKIVLRYSGVKGFRKTGGRVFPGVSLSVAAPGGATIGEFPDLFSGYAAAGMEPKKAGIISVTLTTGKPMKTRAEYTWTVRVWDRKGRGEIVSEMKLRMI